MTGSRHWQYGGGQTISEPPDEEAGEDSRCPACLTRIEASEPAPGCVAFCPECGECFAAPSPWAPSASDDHICDLSRSSEKTILKFPGWVGISQGIMMLVFVAVLGRDDFFYLRLAVAMLAAALLAEGSTRICTEIRNRRPQRPRTWEVPQEIAPEVYDLGPLRAVYPTKNSLWEARAILCVGLACAFFGLFIAQWLVQGGPQVIMLIAAAIGAPLLAVYFLYRAVRSILDRWVVLVFTRGLVRIQGKRTDVYQWEQIRGVAYNQIGDAIDEQAVEIRLSSVRAPLRFTVAHFDNLDKFWQRMDHECSLRSRSSDNLNGP